MRVQLGSIRRALSYKNAISSAQPWSAAQRFSRGARDRIARRTKSLEL